MGKKLSQYARMAQADAVAETLRGIGFEITTVDAAYVIGRTDAVMAWVDFRYDLIWFGRMVRFDRWANSRDYVFEGIPDSPDDLALVIKIATDCADKGLTQNEDFTPLNLNQWWRKYKREAAKAASIPDPVD